MKRRTDPLIFIVEDNPVYNKLIINYLQSKKFNRIESFFSGEECVKRIGEKPDIIIQDYLLEGIGDRSIKTIQKSSFPRRIYIPFRSGQRRCSR